MAGTDLSIDESLPMSPILLKLSALSMLTALITSGFASAPKWKPKDFPISFWCGPPEKDATPERFKEIAEAGFNYTFPACEGPFTTEGNVKILDGAKAAGIKAFIYEDEVPVAITGVPDATKRLDAMVAAYSRHPALAGYFIMDEPSADKFAGLAEVVEYLRKKDPKHPAYINLWPNNAGAKRIGIASYNEYLKRFVEQVKPTFLSYDHYHWTKAGDRPGFTSNLQTVSNLATEHKLDFWQIILSLKHMEYKEPTETEMRCDAMHTLSFGGKGLMYFTYWTPPGKEFAEGEGFIDRTGKRTKRFEEVKRINADVKAIGKYLLNATHEMTYQTGNVEPGVRPQPPDAPVRVEEGNVTVGIFRTIGMQYALIENRDCNSPARVMATFNSTGQPIRRLNRQSAIWEHTQPESDPNHRRTVKIAVIPGDAELFVWSIRP